MSTDLKRMLARWQSAGLIDGQLAQAIADFEATAGPSPAPSSDGSISTTEVITYAGTLIALAGLLTLLRTQYAQLGTIGRLAIPGLIAIASLVAAAVLPSRRARSRRALTSLVALGVAAIAYFVGQAQVELAGGPSTTIPPDTGYRIVLISALSAVVLAAGFLIRLRAGLLAAALALAMTIAAISFSAWAHLNPAWPVEVVFIVAGLLLVLAAEYGRNLRVLWATEVLGFVGPLLPIITAFITAGRGNLPLEIFAAVLAGAAFAAAVFRSSAGYAFAGGVGLFAFVLDIEFRYFKSSLGFAISLVIAGLALLGTALLLARIVPRLRRSI